jgi:TadE-like protein
MIVGVLVNDYADSLTLFRLDQRIASNHAAGTAVRGLVQAMRYFQQIGKDERGSEVAEAAVVLPILFLFLFGILWFGRAFNIYTTITEAAREGSQTASRPACASCAVPSSPCVWPNTTFPCDTTVETTVLGVLQSANLSPSNITVYEPDNLQFCSPPAVPVQGSCSSPTANNITICRSVLMSPAVGAATPQCGSLVSFKYSIQVNMPFTTFNLQQISLQAEAQTRMGN